MLDLGGLRTFEKLKGVAKQGKTAAWAALDVGREI
jgi:hypothetical protein